MKFVDWVRSGQKLNRSGNVCRLLIVALFSQDTSSIHGPEKKIRGLLVV